MDMTHEHKFMPESRPYIGDERRANDKTELILHRLNSMDKAMQDVHASMGKLADSMSRLVLVEERIAQVNEALGRAFKELDSAKGRIAQLEQSAPINKTVSDWVLKAMQGAAGAAIFYVAVKTGLKP